MSFLLRVDGTRNCTEVNMGRELPREVRAGEVVSAAWLNSIVAYLRFLNEQQLRRRILRGVGYQAKESAGGTSLTIDKQAIVRLGEDELDIHRNEDFQLRIKPKNQCFVDEDTGHWDKVVQVHIGRVTNHSGSDMTVCVLEPGSGSSGSASNPLNGTVWDADQWVDVGVISAQTSVALTNTEDTNSTKEVFVHLLPGSSSQPLATFATVRKPDVEGIYIPIGKVQAVVVEDFLRIYIEQYHQGPIELAGDSVDMPFDVSMASTIKEAAEDGKVTELEYSVSVEAGRVFLPDDKFAYIPRKDKLPIIGIGGASNYVTLTLMRDGSGNLKYRYAIESESALGTQTQATEDLGINE